MSICSVIFFPWLSCSKPPFSFSEVLQSLGVLIASTQVWWILELSSSLVYFTAKEHPIHQSVFNEAGCWNSYSLLPQELVFCISLKKAIFLINTASIQFYSSAALFDPHVSAWLRKKCISPFLPLFICFSYNRFISKT